MIRAVVFDIGGVLVQICHEWQLAADTAGVKITNENPGRLVQYAPIDAYQKGSLSFAEYTSQLGEFLGCSQEEAAHVHGCILRAEYPGLYDFMAELKAKGLTLACLSNTAAEHWAEMAKPERFPSFAFLDHKFGSHLEMLNKPDPKIYESAARQMGFEPAEILFFDDHMMNVEGARNCGWESEFVDSSGDTPSQMRKILQERGIL